MKIGFIGCGNMGGSLALAIGRGTDHDVYLCDMNAERATVLAERISARVADAHTLSRECDYIFLGVKPYGIRPLLAELSEDLCANENATLISMAAGVTVDTVFEASGSCHPVIRILPNTPVALGEGMTVYTANALVSASIERVFCGFMRPTGRLDRIDESLIDAACVVSGCGPAYAYMFIEALARAGERAGLSYDAAKTLAAQMMRGAASMVLSIDKSPATLRDEVCSPGGSTIEGVRVLDAEGLDSLVDRAFDASFRRTVELGKPQDT